MTTLTPSLHLEEYSCDDNRFDLRPFLYPRLSWAYARIERAVHLLEKRGEEGGDEGGRSVKESLGG